MRKSPQKKKRLLFEGEGNPSGPLLLLGVSTPCSLLRTLFLLSCQYFLPKLKYVSVDCRTSPQQALQWQAKLQRQKAWSYSVPLTAVEEKSDVHKVKKLNREPSFPRYSIPSHWDYWAVVVRKGSCPQKASCALSLNSNSFGKDLFSKTGWAQFDVTLLGVISDTATWKCTYWK